MVMTTIYTEHNLLTTLLYCERRKQNYLLMTGTNWKSESAFRSTLNKWWCKDICHLGQMAVLPPLPIRSAMHIVLVTTMAMVCTDWHEQYAKLGVYLRNANTRRFHSAMQTPICHKPPNFRIPYFRHSTCHPTSHYCPGHMPHSPPPLPATTAPNGWSSKSQKCNINHNST